jgi:ADP-heptose:LPS heptosyltransferase
MPRILIHFPHGLGDVVQFGVILKHLRKHRPDWEVDVRCGRGKHTALLGMCHRVYHDQEPEPTEGYDTIIHIGFYENYNRYIDRPNSKVTNCLAEVFGLDYDIRLGRYQIQVPQEAMVKTAKYMVACGCRFNDSGKYNAVIVHYEGNTSSHKKNLGHWQAQAICEVILRAGRIPIVLDWDSRSSVPDNKRIFNPGCSTDDLWGSFGSGDAATIAAMMHQAEAIVGIDSGPGKVASSTQTPTLICWRGLHPIQFHDPADNTIHLVPEHHERLPPCCDKSEIVDYFKQFYQYRTYEGEHGLVAGVTHWLCEILNVEIGEVGPVQFVMPNGIGDIMWTFLKIRQIAADRPMDVLLSGDPRKEIDNRAVPFVRRFPFIRHCVVSDLPVLNDKERRTDTRGRYDYVSDGMRGNYHYLIPNRTLEAGRRIEEWLPEYKCDWNVVNEFSWENTERGKEMGEALRPFVAFYLGPESGNVDEGHNRSFMWEPKHWIEMGKYLTDKGFKIAVVGAPYDRSYWERYVRDGTKQQNMHWLDFIGSFEIGETFALLREAKFFVSYQCGLAIMMHYFGQKVITWWRPENNSCHPEHLVTFAEAMKDAWTNPALKDNYYGAVYGRETVGDLLAEIDRRGWLT